MLPLLLCSLDDDDDDGVNVLVGVSLLEELALSGVALVLEDPVDDSTGLSCSS